MANPYLILWCDPSQNKIYSGWQKNSQAQTPVLKQGDDIGVELHWVRASSLTASMQEIVFPPTATIRLAVGRVDAQPVGGTFTMTYGADTTPALTYSMTATEIEAALNDLPSITAEGGVTVSKSGNQFRILWNEVGAISTALSANVDMLYPTSQASIVESRAGTTGTSRIILFKIKQSAIAATTEFNAISAPELTSTSIFANTWRISAYPYPKEGVWSITVLKGATSYRTISLPADASSLQVSSALNALNVEEGSTFSVVKSGDFTWDITAPTSVDAINVTSGLIGFSAMYGVLSMNTAEVEEFLSGETSGQARLEVEVDVAGEIQTIAQVTVNVINDLIDLSSFNIVQRETVMPIDSVVRYDTSQALTEAQKLTARQNIDTNSIDEIIALYPINRLPSQNEKAALVGSILPSSSNPYVTMSERNPFDQDLNTTDDVQFNTVTVGTNSVVIDGTSVSVSDGTDTLLIQPTGITFADSSVQDTAFQGNLFLTKAGNLSGLGDISVARTNLGLGTIAVESASNYLSKAGNLSGLSDTSVSRSNLGLGTMAVETATNYLSKAGNLSGLASTSIARNNLGLGTMATQSADNYITVGEASQEIATIVNSQIGTLLQQKQNKWSTWLYTNMVHDLTAFPWERGDNTSIYIVKEASTKKGLSVPNTATNTYTFKFENPYSQSWISSAFKMLWFQFATMTWTNVIGGNTYTYNVNGINNAKIVISDDDSLTSQNRIEIGHDSGGTYVSFWGIESNQFVKYYRDFGDMSSDSIFTLIFSNGGFYFSNNLQPVDFGTNGQLSPVDGGVGTKIYSCTSSTEVEQGNEHWIGAAFGNMKYVFLVVEQGDIGNIGIQGMKFSAFDGDAQ